MGYESKYLVLRDRDLLARLYEQDKMSIPQIGDRLGIPRGSVRQALIAHEIPLRLYVPKVCLPPNLLNPTWLKNKYWNEGLSLMEIAKEELGDDKLFSYVRNALVRFHIPIRTKSQGHTYLREGDGFQFERDVIDGCLLGDGSLKVTNPDSDDAFPVFAKKNVNQDHVEYVARILMPSHWRGRIRVSANDGGYNKGVANPKPAYWFNTLTHVELLPVFRSWYPKSNGYKKVIPEDIVITKRTLLHWFMDDGTAFLRKWYYIKDQRKEFKTKQYVLSFACQAFTEESLWILCGKIYDKLDIGMTPTLHQWKGKYGGTGMEVSVKSKYAEKFYDLIGACPVPSMEYKWLAYTHQNPS